MAISRNIAYLGGLSGVLLLAALMITVPELAKQGVSDVCTIDGECQHEQHMNLLIALIPVFIGGGAILGAISYYTFYERTAPVKKEADASLTVSLMEKDESKILAKLVAEGGRITQSEVSRIEGIGKVKAHRILSRLEKRGIVSSEKYGKTNMVKVSDKYRKLFLKD
ncbi:MAG: helix-turn-helix domain-containing protein [Candidatus Micrarchaeota archaeon]